MPEWVEVKECYDAPERWCTIDSNGKQLFFRYKQDAIDFARFPDYSKLEK